MPYDRIASLSPFDFLTFAFSLPLFSLVVAAVVTGIVLIVARAREDRRQRTPMTSLAVESVAVGYRREHLAVGIGAILVIVGFAIENVVRGYMLNLVDIVEWWQYATPVFVATLSLTVALVLIVFRGSAPPEQPVLSVARRTWTTFIPRAGLLGASVTLAVLLTTTIAAGMASSADDRGRYIYVEIAVPNEEAIGPLRPWFYGWSFGVPVLVCAAALVVVAWATLRANAIRSFRRPETVSAEQAARVQIASGVVRIATGGMLLALAGAWRFIGRSGSFSQLTVGDAQGETYEASWRYSEFAAAGGLLAPALEITAFILLLLVASRIGRSTSRHRTAAPVEHLPNPEAVR
ncbi:hypothetical protein FLP10_12000 [Agromyces intestinalis]|uniref:Uncharacterized protein n=1 Tax=Agromyces intestinalis TaxID=2592652 RepID=A0A5C1YJ09_9MICO|nr:hypothetical protein [Agromyces intestinalis]QEO15057.1 hypothetical protein FLP10_12000 [Agromyces intestinalis]